MATLIEVANALAGAESDRPSQSHLRRAVSTAYYALFEALAREGADQLIGADAEGTADWVQVFRALDHGPARTACAQIEGLGLSPELVAFAEAFVSLQQQRHRADYDPTSRYDRDQALALIEDAEGAIDSLARAPRSDRRTLIVLSLFRKR